MVLNADNEITHANRTDSTGQRIVFAGGNKAYSVEMTNGTKGLGSYKEITTGSSLQNNFFTVDLSTLNQVDRFSSVNNSSSWRETSKTDAFSRLKSTPTRDAINLKPTQIDYADGTQRVTVYNPFATPLSHTDRLDRLTQSTFDSFGNKLSQTRGVGSPEASTQTWLYNAQGLVIEHRDALYDPAFPELHNTQYEYDANNYPTKKIHAADIAGGTRPETLYSWDSTGRLASTTDPLGRTVTYTYDNRSRLIQTTYNDTSTELVEYGTGADANLIVKTTDRNGIETTYSYDASDRVTSTELRDPSLPLTDPALRTASYTYLNGTNLEQTATIDGNTTETLFDHQNRVIGTKSYPDTTNTLETSQEIDVLGRTRSTTDAYGRKTYYLYDQNDRVTRTVTETVPNGLPSVPAFDNTSSQTSSQKNYTFTDLAANTLETDSNNDGYTHEVTYTDARDLYLQNLTRDLSTNAAYLITDSIYDAEGQLLVATNAKGIIIWMEYDQLGRNILTIEALGTADETRSENIYDDQSNLVEIRHPRYFSESINDQDQYTYNGRNLKSSHTTAPGTPEAATQSWTYLADARLDQHTDYRGNTLTYIWHVCCGRLQATVDRDGQSTTIFNTDYAGQSTHTATVTTNPAGNWHDPIDANTLQETTTRYDGRGRPTFTTRWLVAQGNIIDHARASLSNGVIPIAGQNSIPATDGLTTSYTYDEDLTDGLGLDVTYSAQLANLPITLGPNATGSAVEMTNPAGEKSVQIMDGLGRTIMSINPEGDYTTMTYDAISTPQADGAQAPLAATPIPGDLLKTSSTDANGNTSSSYSDGAGRTLATTDAINNANYAGYNAASSRVAYRDPNGLGEDCTLDALERETSCSDLQEQAEATSRTTSYNTASQPVSNTDAEGNSSSMVYDVRGRLESTTDANNITVSYFYDANNNLTALIDGNGNQRTWTYDARNLNTAKTYPGGGGDTCLYTHDALRRIVDKTDQANTIHRHNYDLASRLTSKEYLTGGTTLESTDTFTYDAASRITSTNKGRHAISTTHTYALDSMPLSQTVTANGRSYTMSRSYDAGNRVTSHSYPDNKATTWSYDARNLITSVSYDGESVITKTHDAGYRLTNATYGNGLTRTISYTRQDNLRTSDTTFDGITALADLNFSYSYAADKQITAETIAAGGVLPNNASFTANYDPGNRLTSWTRAGYPTGSGVTARQSQSWNFDNAGNWTSTILDGTTQNRTHNVKDQTTVLDGNATTHDVRGNLLTFEHNSKDYTITYDVENRITQVDVDNDDVEYRYDAFGRRTIRKEGSDEKVLLWWGSSECAEYEHTATHPTIQNDIFCDPNQLNAVIARAVDGSKFDLEYYHKNYLDHVYAVSDDNGNLIEHYRYTAYGEQEVYNSTGTLIATSAIGNEITWNTRRVDTITGFYMYQYRHYAPQLGKWPSRDLIEEEGGVNLYGFVGNNGVNYWDYLGLERLNLAYRVLEEDDVYHAIHIGGVHVKNLLELTAKISNRVDKYHPEGIDPCNCIEKLTIFAHSGKGGQMDLGTDGLSHFDMKQYNYHLNVRKKLENARKRGDKDAVKKHRKSLIPSRDSFQRIDRLKKIAKYMCKGGKVDFVVCAAAAGDKGKKLQGQLESIFGSGNVIMYENDCKAHFRNHTETDSVSEKRRQNKGIR